MALYGDFVSCVPLMSCNVLSMFLPMPNAFVDTSLTETTQILYSESTKENKVYLEEYSINLINQFTGILGLQHSIANARRYG